MQQQFERQPTLDLRYRKLAIPLCEHALTLQKVTAGVDAQDTRSLLDVYVDLTQAPLTYEEIHVMRRISTPELVANQPASRIFLSRVTAFGICLVGVLP